MKKYLFSALALPLLFACSTDDFEKPVASNDPFPGIEKVNATFSLDEGPVTRMATDWDIEVNDRFGFAWLGDGTIIKPTDETNGGKAFQNHPLTVVNDAKRGKIFQPQTSIYVGKYYLYAPYDEETVSPQAINFESLKKQDVFKGKASGWSSLAKNAIIIGDKWTDVSVDGTEISGSTWNKAGIDNPFKIYAAVFSNQTGLDLTYVKNNPSFTGTGKAISGATDISYTLAAGEPVGSADIYSGTVQLEGAANQFTYAPKAEPNTGAHAGTFWANKSGNAGDADNGIVIADKGFVFPAAASIGLTFIDKDTKKSGVSTGADGSKGWFWFNSLPVTAGNATVATTVTTVLETTYGSVTVKTGENYDQNVTVGNSAWAYDDVTEDWFKIDEADAAATATTPKKWGIGAHSTFINQYGNHSGKYALTVDFSKAVMNNMHIKDDQHLQKALKYYLASGKTEEVNLWLDGASATDKTFKLSKMSIALLQTINATANKVLVKACTEAEHNAPVKIIITQEGQTGELAAKKEVPALNKVFAAETAVYLASGTEWTWTGDYDGDNVAEFDQALPVDENVTSITNEGTLTVNATNVQLSVATATLANAPRATMNITKVTTVKNALTNLGTINVGSDSEEGKKAELRAYDVAITNDAKTLPAKYLTDPKVEEIGLINNYGVVGVTAGTAGKFNNYGLIDMKDGEAITLLTTNEKNANSSPFGPFKSKFVAGSNMMGTVVLPDANPYAIVSVSNGAETGFIKYNWTAATYTHDPGNVKYNTIVVKSNIAFTGDAAATEIQFIVQKGFTVGKREDKMGLRAADVSELIFDDCRVPKSQRLASCIIQSVDDR